jgi:hypothetical protein
MRVLLSAIVFALSAGPLLSADEPRVDPHDAPNYIGQSVTVSRMVIVFVSRNGNDFFYFGDKYPKRIFTGWIPGGTHPWLELLQGKTAKITGVIELYHGKPEIKITSRDQIVSG